MKTMVAVVVLVTALSFLPAWAGPVTDAVGGPDWLRYGVDLRLRQNYLDFHPARDGEFFYRVRPRAWLGVSPVEEIEIFFKLVNEYRYYFLPEGFVHPLRDEVIFENLYLDVKKPFDLPLSVRIGRQDLIYGEGFVILEGGPNDGSRSFYSDGIRASIDLDPTTIDLIAVYNTNDQDQFFIPFVINEVEDFKLDDQKTGLYGAYLVNRSLIPDFRLEGYYLFKDGKESEKVVENRIHTLGARLAGRPVKGLTTVAEGAIQLGDWGDESHRAYGGYAYGTYQIPGCPVKSALTLGYVLLSGDDPETDRHEGWDPLFGRWPKWSELYLYTLAFENGPGYWTNMQILRAAWATQPIERMSLTLGVNYLLALENPFAEDPRGLFSDGRVRGLNPRFDLRYRFNDWMSAQWLIEYFRPGNYYQEDMRSELYARTELMINF